MNSKKLNKKAFEELQYLLSVCEIIEPNSKSYFTDCFIQLLKRSIPLQILRDPEFTDLIKQTSIYQGRESEKIKKILESRTSLELSDETISSIVEKVYEYRKFATDPNRNISSKQTKRFLAKKILCGQIELRCHVCGYHFRSCDMSEERLEIVNDIGFTLSDNFHPRRVDDPFKPTIIGDKNLTELHIDHISPRMTYGSNDTRNLEILCSFCNTGKSFYYYPLEPLSTSIPHSIEMKGKVNRIGQVVSIVSKLRNEGIAFFDNKNKSFEISVTKTKNKPTVSPFELKIIKYE